MSTPGICAKSFAIYYSTGSIVNRVQNLCTMGVVIYADDLVLIAESGDKLTNKLRVWKKGFEKKGLKVNERKTKVMRCSDELSVAKDSGKFHVLFVRKVLAVTQFVVLTVGGG